MAIEFGEYYWSVSLNNIRMRNQLKDRYPDIKDTGKRYAEVTRLNDAARDALKAAGLKTSYRYKKNHKGLAMAMVKRMQKVVGDYPVSADKAYPMFI